MNIILNIIALIVLLLLCVGYIRRTVALLPLTVFVLYQAIWLLVSTAYVEQGVYLTDTQTVSYFNGSTIRLGIFWIVFFGGSLLGFNLCRRLGWMPERKDYLSLEDSAIRQFNGLFYTLSMLVCLALCAILALNLALSGTILTNSDITRFNFYRDYSAIGFAQYISYAQGAICLYAGMVLAYRRTVFSKVLAGTIFVFQVLYLWLIGNEASAFMTSTLFFILPLLAKYLAGTDNIASKLRRVTVLCTVMVVAVLAIKYLSSIGTTIYGAENENSFAYRFLALQANTWWNVDRLAIAGGLFDVDQWFKEISQIYSGAGTSGYGIWYLMEQIMPQPEYLRYVLGNGTLNAGYPAINVAIIGYFMGSVMTLLDGILFAFACVYFYRKIMNGQFVCACLMAIVFNQVVRTFTMGGIGYLCNALPMLCMALLLFWELISFAAKIGKARDRSLKIGLPPTRTGSIR